jgi:hypothetical protein
MASRRVKIWFDREGDFLEVMFGEHDGFFRETANEQVMQKVDVDGNVVGFTITGVSSLAREPLEVIL